MEQEPEAPGTPCADDLQLYYENLQHLRCSEAKPGKSDLILGTTPQIIDWCRQNDLRTTVLHFYEVSVRRIKSSMREWPG